MTFWNSLRLLITFLALSFGYTTIAGCQGAPQYAGVKAKPDNEVDLGWGRYIRFGAETEVMVKGLKTPSGAGLDEATFKSSPATTMREGWVPAMGAYVPQQQAFNDILKTHYAGLNEGQRIFWSGANEMVNTLAPHFSELLALKNRASAVEIGDKPLIANELMNLAANGIDVTKFLGALPPEWKSEIEAKIKSLLSPKPVGVQWPPSKGRHYAIANQPMTLLE